MTDDAMPSSKTGKVHPFNAETGQVSAELACHGTAAGTRVHVPVEVVGEQPEALPVAVIAQVDGASDWLADEPDLWKLQHKSE